MEPESLATTLILTSAMMHAVWNAVLKSGSDRTAMIGVMNVVGAVISLPFLMFVPFPSPEGWGWIGASITIHLVYQLSLARMFAAADYSLVYPIARGIGPLVVTFVSVAFLAENLAPVDVAAILILISGAVVAGLASNSQTPHKANAQAFGWAGLVGLLIGFYTLVDGTAVKQMQPFSFILWSNVLIMPFMLLFLHKTNSAGFNARMYKVWPKALGMTFFSYGGYTLALFAFRLGGLAEIAALRETSILFAALIGVFWLKEHLVHIRLVGISLIAIGAIALKLL